jgi:hypothetical protein
MAPKVEVFQKYTDAPDRIDGFQYVFGIGYFNTLRIQRFGPLRMEPRAQLNEGVALDKFPTVAVFCA